MTTDAAKAQRFYSALFGWRIHERPMQGFVYRMIEAGPGPIGGIVQEPGIPATHWMPYVAVDDVDAAVSKWCGLGGSACVPPTDIPNTGRFAVVGDPQGVYLTLYRGQGDAHGFDPDQPVPGRVCWNELLTADAEAAQRFYAAMFGWQDQPKDLGPCGTYHVQLLGGKQVGGLMKNPSNGAPNAWLAYFLAPDLAATTGRAGELGAQVLMANVPIQGIGVFSMCTDPTGGAFALFEPL